MNSGGKSRNMAAKYQTGGQVGYPYPCALRQDTERKGSGLVHLLLYHLIDVGQVALHLWCDALSSQRESGSGFRPGHRRDPRGPVRGTSGPRSMIWARQVLLIKESMLDRRFSHLIRPASNWFIRAIPRPPKAIHLTARCRLGRLPNNYAMPRPPSKKSAQLLATAVGGHHGVWPGPGATDHLDDSCVPAWARARKDLLWEVRGVFRPLAVRVPSEVTEMNALLTVVSALTSVANWIDSREDSFSRSWSGPCPPGNTQSAPALASEAVRCLGWTGWPAPRR